MPKPKLVLPRRSDPPFEPVFRMSLPFLATTLLALIALGSLSSARGATMSSSASAPVVNGKDIANFSTVNGTDKWFVENSAAGAAKGQTFTTGPGAVLFKSITYQVASSQKAEPTKQYVIRIGTVAGSTFAPVHTETATQSATWGGGHYMTWTFNSPILLNGNTIYGVDIGMTGSTSAWQTGIPYLNVTASNYAGGNRYNSGTNGIGTSSITNVGSSDRIFHLDLELPLGASLDLVATDPADGAAEVMANRPLTLTFSQNVAPGDGDLLFRNLTDNTELAVPSNGPAVTISENVVTVVPAGGLQWNKNFAVRIEPGAITNTSGTAFAGIADDTTWNFSTAAGDPLLDAIADLKSHIQGATALSAARIAAIKATFDNLRDQFDDNAVNIAAVFDLVTTYDMVEGPLWVARGEFNRTTQTDDLDWTIFHVMQYIMDVVYHPGTIAGHEALLTGFKFGSSSNFPGPCPAPAPGATHTATINASFPDTFGRVTQGDDLPARKPTGCYLAPGTIATVTVPPALVGQGFKVRVGAHSWDLSQRSPVRRLDRATLLYPLDAATIKIASPYGGGIYIEVPRLANAGIVAITINGATRSPYFSAKSFHQTSAAEWLAERAHPAPWADFQSDKFMMQVPSKWINTHPDPAKLMADWDKAMDAQNDLMGFPRLRGKETQYPQVDVLMRSSVHAPGYPSVNNVDNPNSNRGGYHNNYLVRGPGNNYHSANIEFHEQGHAYFFPKFGGETESTVNLAHVAILNGSFGYPLDEAFRGSLGSTRGFQTLDTTAVAWMCVFNFAPRRVPMAEAEKAYQLKGHAKFVDIARLYGWQVLGDYWRSFQEDDANGVSYSTSTDALLLRLCKSVGKDIRPLFHFWGIPPQNNTSLGAALAAANIPPDPAIRARLLHYRTLIPADNAAFRSFATAWWGKQPNFSTGAWEEREHARQWDTTALYGAGDQQRTDATNPGEIYNTNSATDIRNRVGEIVDLYFDDYTAWAGDYPGVDLTDPADDLDGDGLSNGEERLWGLDPTRGTSSSPVTFPVGSSPGSFRYTRRDPSLTGLSHSVWTSPDLGTWTLDPGAVQIPGAPVNGIETVDVTLSPSLLASPRLFIQVRTAE